MGIYYKLVNPKTKERIEPSRIDGGGIKRGAIIGGGTSRLYTWLHLQGSTDWILVPDEGSDLYDNSREWPDCTQAYVEEYNDDHDWAAIVLDNAEFFTWLMKTTGLEDHLETYVRDSKINQ